MYSEQSKEQIVQWLTCLPKSLFTLGFLSAALVLNVYYEALETNGPFVFQEQQVLKELSGFTGTIVVNVFIDRIDHPMPQSRSLPVESYLDVL